MAGAYAYYNRPAIGLGLLLAACILAAPALLYLNFTDEADKLAGGWLIANGQMLYRDIFTHHFPWAYYWAASVVALFGRSLLAARLSMEFLQLLAFALVMRMTRAYLTVGLALVGWTAVAHLYNGQMLIYNVFAAVAVLVDLAMATVWLTGYRRAHPKTLVLFGLFLAIALLSDPLSSLPLGALMTILAASRRVRHRIVIALVVCGLLLAAYVAYLYSAGSIDDAYRDLILFNTTVYAKYGAMSIQSTIISAAGRLSHGLDLFTPASWWGRGLAPGLLGLWSPFARWLFAGFLYRLGVLCAAAGLMLRRHWLAALAVYSTAALALTRSYTSLQQSALVLVALFAVAWTAHLWLTNAPGARSQWPLQQGPRMKSLVPGLISLSLLGLLLWPLPIGVVSLVKLRSTLSYQYSFGDVLAQAGELQHLAGNRDVRLGYYPGEPFVHFFSGLRPVAGYLYMWPWVAEVGQADVIASLQAGSAIVVLRDDQDVLGYATSQYLADLKDWLDLHYVRVSPHTYLAPDVSPAP